MKSRCCESQLNRGELRNVADDYKAHNCKRKIYILLKIQKRPDNIFYPKHYWRPSLWFLDMHIIWQRYDFSKLKWRPVLLTFVELVVALVHPVTWRKSELTKTECSLHSRVRFSVMIYKCDFRSLRIILYLGNLRLDNSLFMNF